jgi:disulfide bond formation protein DsbB
MRFISFDPPAARPQINPEPPLAPCRGRVHIAAMPVQTYRAQSCRATSYRVIGLIAAVAAALALAIAHGSERWEGLVPCALCLWERWPYRIAVILGLAAALLPPRSARVAMGLLVVTLLGEIALAAIHAGVEFHWWPSPLPECAAPSFGGGSIAERLARMPAVPAKPCDDPSYLIPGLPVSMVQMNLIFACVFTAAAVWVTARKPRR